MQVISGTPRKDGFHMSAEFEPHRGTWILWPERLDNWRLNARPGQQTFASVARVISQFERVTVGATATSIDKARQMLPAHIEVVEVTYDDAWVRDTGPVCVVNGTGKVRGIDWEFNSWGAGIFPSWEQDNRVAAQVLEYEALDTYKNSMVLEGGAIIVDGEGTVLTTEECLLNSNRNPTLSKVDVENILQEYLNIEKIIWLKRGIYLDEAGGHIDNLCVFTRPGVVVLNWTSDKADPQYDISMEAYELLQDVTDAKGRKLEVHKLHQPNPMYITKEESEGFIPLEGSVVRKEGDRLPASYINFYIVNGGVVIPLFNDQKDSSAQQMIQKLFPDRKVVGVPSRELLLGGGAIHCIVQQIPRG